MSRKQMKSNLSLMYDLMADARRFHKGQKTFFVDSALAGSVAFGGRQWASAIPDINTAYTNCTAARGDRIIVAPTHAETRTAVMDLTKSYVSIEGEVWGNKYPVFTINGAVDLFSFSAAAQTLQNLQLTIITTDAATALVNFAAASCKVSGCKLIPSSTAENVVDVFTIASGGDDGVIEKCEGHNTIVAVNSWISIEAAVARFTIGGLNDTDRNYFSGDVATAGIIDGATATQLLLANNTIKTIGTNIPALILDSNPTGNAYGNDVWGTDATIGNNAQWGTALIVGRNTTRGGTGSAVSASTIIPAMDT